MDLNLTICIITYNRPEGLNRLLVSLSKLEFEKTNQPDWRVVIIDNNSPISIEPIINEIRKTFPKEIIFGSELTQGIASARNKAFKLAKNSDFIAFIDDDEIADPFWLDELLSVQQITNADVVTGPVLPLFESPPPNWVIEGEFFNRHHYKTTSEVKYAYTHNILIRTEWLEKVKGPFNTKMNLIGGSDTLFSQQIRVLGAKIVWADEAIVKEYNPPDRATVRWLLSRSFRTGITLTLVEKWTIQPFHILIIRLGKGLSLVVLGILYLIPGIILHGKVGWVRGLRKISRGMGELVGFIGVKYKEYKM